jgi:deoxyribose-phosphate aldolase
VTARPPLAPAEIDELVRRVAARLGVEPPTVAGGEPAGVPADLARFIDHTLLRADATAEDIDRLCDEARRHGFASVCVNPSWVARVASRLAGSGVDACSVVGFPLGAHTPAVKAAEAAEAIRDGAREIDMVINIGALRSGDLALVERDIAGVAAVCRRAGAVCKVIIEAAMLTDEEKVAASLLAERAGAHFVKTSTGFGPGGATAYDVALMHRAVGPEIGIKAAGGIRTRQDAEALIAAGATRLGTSAGVAIATGS